MIATTPEWDLEQAASTYNVDRWGTGYFQVTEKGTVGVTPDQSDMPAIDLMEVVEEARQRGLAFPLVVRFQDILRHRVVTINEAFREAIEEANYTGTYKGVFPIKVNQLREVVEEIVDAGKPYHFGMEAGSKPELLAALALHEDPESLIVCNGYKDRLFIENALLGRKLGKQVIMVVEKLEELAHILEISKQMNVEPMIGIRVRLQSKGAGKWATSGGENAKFGLPTADLLEASRLLKEAGLAQALKLVHFHVGSQVPDITTLNCAIREATRFYCKLKKLGHDLGFLDVGGGLGIDYDGSRTNYDSSVNYTLREYARDVVYTIQDICESEEVPAPTIVSESGRAIVAHHSVLLVEAFGSIEKDGPKTPELDRSTCHKLAKDILELQETLTSEHRLEQLHDAQAIKDQAQTLFDVGILELQDKAIIETTYWEIARTIVSFFDDDYRPEEVTETETLLSDQYLCNFSVFQSLLDHWALGQVFPIMPIHRLEEQPKRQATLVDITCDSDGKISKFIDLHDIKETLPLHDFQPGTPYYIGIFLAGAYQDIMGDLHNLFGRVNELHVFVDEDEDEGWYVEETIGGSTIAQVLELTQWNQTMLLRLMKTQFDQAIRDDRLKPTEGMKLLKRYERTLRGYTYLQLQTENA